MEAGGPFPLAGVVHAYWNPYCGMGYRGGRREQELVLCALQYRRSLDLGLGLGLRAFGGSLVQMGTRYLMDLELRYWLATEGSSIDLIRSVVVLGTVRHGLRLEVCAARSRLCLGVLVCAVVRPCLVVERAVLMRRFRCCMRLYLLVDRCLLVAGAELREVLVCRMGTMGACACLGPLELEGRSCRSAAEIVPLDVEVARAVGPC